MLRRKFLKYFYRFLSFLTQLLPIQKYITIFCSCFVIAFWLFHRSENVICIVKVSFIWFYCDFSLWSTWFDFVTISWMLETHSLVSSECLSSHLFVSVWHKVWHKVWQLRISLTLLLLCLNLSLLHFLSLRIFMSDFITEHNFCHDSLS